MKQCNGCGECKPMEAFGQDKTCLDGRRGTCLVCRSGQARAAYTKRTRAVRWHPQMVADAWRETRVPAINRGLLGWRLVA